MPAQSSAQARGRFEQAPVARLATVSEDGQPHLVPIVFAVVGDVIVTAVDHKPKTTVRLRRLANIVANPRVTLLVDEYADDWSQLWWARADGIARTTDEPGDGLRTALITRYPQYDECPPGGPYILIDVDRWSGWSAA
jgi:PPOX class probable F420-dependent enzyme